MATTNQSRTGSLKPSMAVLVFCLPLLLPACTNTMLRAARQDMAAGRYDQAHADLTAALETDLSSRQRREARDEMCAIEFQTGAPTYSLLRQHQTCSAAGREPGSTSGPLLAQIDGLIREKQAADMQQALASRDLAAAISVALAYRAVEPRDNRENLRWNREIWALAINEERSGGSPRRSQLAQTLALLSPRFSGEQKMSRQGFERWLAGAAWQPSAAPATTVAIHQHQLKLTLDGSAPAARNLARINDAFIVWCRCDGTTYAIDQRTGLPVSIARVNPWLLRSEVIELPRAQPVIGAIPDSSDSSKGAGGSGPRRESSRRLRSNAG